MAPDQVPSSHKRRAGRKKFQETRHPVFRGVRQRRVGKWVCEVREPHKKSRIWLGTFPSPEMAARAHDVAALALRGSSAPLNFPNSSWALPRPESSSVKDIQAAAAEAARGFSDSALPPPPASADEFVDEEAEFNLPTLLTSMAEGLLLAPPRVGFDEEDHGYLDLSLWSHHS